MDPAKSPKKEGERAFGKLKRIKNHDAGNAAAGTDAWRHQMGSADSLKKAADERGQKNEREETPVPEVFFDFTGEEEEEIHIAKQMAQSAVQKKRRQEGDPAITPPFRGDEPEILHGVFQVKKCDKADNGNHRA